MNKYPISERSVFQIKDEPNKEIPTNPQGWNYKKVEAPIKGKWLHVYKESYDGIYEEQIVEQILANKGGLVTGPAGTGKSVILRTIMRKLATQEQNIKVCAYTHAAARLVGGMTVSRLLHLDKSLHDAWILIDEISILPIDTIGALARLSLVGAKFICFGDFDGQFEAAKDRWDTP